MNNNLVGTEKEVKYAKDLLELVNNYDFKGDVFNAYFYENAIKELNKITNSRLVISHLQKFGYEKDINYISGEIGNTMCLNKLMNLQDGTIKTIHLDEEIIMCVYDLADGSRQIVKMDIERYDRFVAGTQKRAIKNNVIIKFI